MACTFWLVDALVRTGQVARAEALMERGRWLSATTSAILSEQMDPSTGELLGNVPQGLSHLALINAAHALHHARLPEKAGHSDQVLERR